MTILLTQCPTGEVRPSYPRPSPPAAKAIQYAQPAAPAAPYGGGPTHVPSSSYSWAVKDDYSFSNFNAHEERDGYNTAGGYTVALPDGRTQIVTYTATKVNYFVKPKPQKYFLSPPQILRKMDFPHFQSLFDPNDQLSLMTVKTVLNIECNQIHLTWNNAWTTQHT